MSGRDAHREDAAVSGAGAGEHRRTSAEHWEEAAPGWIRRQSEIREIGAPVSHWLVHAIDPQPAQRVLELAAGIGETGLLAAELVAPAGGVILSDQADAMLDGARARAAELGLTNVEFQNWNAEWIDLPVASVDAVLCRWGYMLMADPLAALLETRRVLRPGGRLALAVWDAASANPWATEPRAVLVERGLLQSPDGNRPGPFALGDAERLRGLLEQAGFTDVLVDALDLAHRYASFEAFWETTLDLSRELHDVVFERSAEEIERIRGAVEERLRPFVGPDGTLEIPGRSLVAAAGA